MLRNLSLDQLRVLVTIAETGSFSAAGRKLRRVQSAVSQAIASLETIQGVTLFDRSGHRPQLTDVGRVLVAQARAVLAQADRFEAMTTAARDGVEPELAIAIDPLVPTSAFIASLQALGAAFPHLAVSFSTEGLGGAERSLRRGAAALAFCILLPTVPDDVAVLPLLAVDLIPVVSPSHPLAHLGRPATRIDLGEHVQLVLSDPSAPEGPSYGVMSVKTWRFVELGRRLDFLRAGLGWCRMPAYLVQPLIDAGELNVLSIADDPARADQALTIYAAHLRSRPVGRAGAWLLEDLRGRFEVC